MLRNYLVASLLGSVSGYFMSRMLLDSIWDYFIEIKAGIMISASMIIFIATLITVITKVIRASMKNPVVSLRYE
ncbi:MAG TPA: hypothetical protein VMV74_04080 [Bacteroidales bacterium]|nr:hypothetical protein [Bacteroidales bacterium]